MISSVDEPHLLLGGCAHYDLKKKKHAVNRAIIPVTQHLHYLCYFFSASKCCVLTTIDGFSLLLQRYVRKVNDAKNPVILTFF